MKTRFEECRRKVREMRQEFDTAVIVDTRKEGECYALVLVQISYVAIWYSPEQQERKCFVKTGSRAITAALRP